MKILLHACCGPCSLEPTRLLQEKGASFALFYSNSNIYPHQEYNHRGETLAQFAQSEGFSLIQDTYDAHEWETRVGTIGNKLHELCVNAGIENEVIAAPNPYPLPELPNKGAEVARAREKAAHLRRARCQACCRLRFQHAAKYAANHGFDALGTTLSVSPFQYTHIIQAELERAACQASIASAFFDYRPFFAAAEARSKALGMYRQNYCGCRFSLEEAALERAVRKQARKERRKEKRTAAQRSTPTCRR